MVDHEEVSGHRTPGNMRKHILRLKGHGKIENESEYFSHFDKLVDWIKDRELILLPDRRTPVELAKRARKRYGRDIKITGAVLQDDEEFGIEHLTKYYQYEDRNP